MKIPLIQIGNSWGTRIPKAILKQCDFKKSVTIKVVEGNLVLSSDDNPREGWEDAFKKMAAAGDDLLFDADTGETTFDKDEWEW